MRRTTATRRTKLHLEKHLLGEAALSKTMATNGRPNLFVERYDKPWKGKIMRRISESRTYMEWGADRAWSGGCAEQGEEASGPQNPRPTAGSGSVHKCYDASCTDVRRNGGTTPSPSTPSPKGITSSPQSEKEAADTLKQAFEGDRRDRERGLTKQLGYHHRRTVGDCDRDILREGARWLLA